MPAAGLTLNYAINAFQASTLTAMEHAPSQAPPLSLASEDPAQSADYTTSQTKHVRTDALHANMDVTYATMETLVNALNASQSTTY